MGYKTFKAAQMKQIKRSLPFFVGLHFDQLTDELIECGGLMAGNE